MVKETKFKERSSISTKKAILFSFLLICFMLLVAESGIRVWAYYFRATYERYNSDLRRYELIPNIRSISPSGAEFLINSKGFAGREFKNTKPEGVYRIFALGDSCTLGYWNIVYAGLLDRSLNSTNSRRQFEVINAGIEGYNSQHALARLREDVLQYDPDMVTIYIGWNDLMKVNPDNLSATGRYTLIANVMERSYLMKVYSKLIFYYLRPLIIQPKLIIDEAERNAYDGFVPTAFQENLETMIEVLEKKGIKTLLMTLPTAVTSGMTYEEIKKRKIFFPYYAGSYSVGKLLSLQRSYNRSIRRTASKYSIPIVDLDDIFNKYDKENLFWDTMHPSEKGHLLIAQTLTRKIQELLQ